MNKKEIDIILSNLRNLRLPAMADTLMNNYDDVKKKKKSLFAILKEMTDNELTSRKDNAYQRHLKNAKIPMKSARIREIDMSPERDINKELISQLSDDTYILKRRNIVILGACGTGKSYIASALAREACRFLHKTLYTNMYEILEETNIERAAYKDSFRAIDKYTKPEVLIIDDFLNRELSNDECIDLFKITKKRYGLKSTIYVSQFDYKEWHKALRSSPLADSIIDRIKPNAYRLILKGPSLRGKLDSE